MSMQCCGEKRGLHIVVRKGGDKSGLLVDGVLWMFPKGLEVL
jgi:hypothetical protein